MGLLYLSCGMDAAACSTKFLHLNYYVITRMKANLDGYFEPRPQFRVAGALSVQETTRNTIAVRSTETESLESSEKKVTH